MSYLQSWLPLPYPSSFVLINGRLMGSCLSITFFSIPGTLKKYRGNDHTTISASSIFPITVCISSFMQHTPGVFCQHAKQPLHAPTFIEATCISSMDTASFLLLYPSLKPSIKLFASLNELLRLPFGLPLIRSMFMLYALL